MSVIVQATCPLAWFPFFWFPVKKLFAAISGHGYGHMSQVAPVLRELRKRVPDIEITLQSTVPTNILDERLGFSFQQIDQSPDVGMLMDDALTVKVMETVAEYQQFHSNWNDRLDDQMAILEEQKPDLVLCDVPYLPLIAAKKLDIPAVAICSLNWKDILEAYTSNVRDLQQILHTMEEAYQGADVFLQPEPSMPMEWLRNRRSIGPVATQHQGERQALLTQLGLPETARIVLITLGGIDTAFDIDTLPIIADHIWLVSGNWRSNRQDCIHANELQIPFGSIVASVDAIVTKPGYGTFVEAANAGVPVLYLQRKDWPEEAVLTSWLKENANAMEIKQKSNGFDGIEVPLKQILNQRKYSKTKLSGVVQAVDIIQQIADQI